MMKRLLTMALAAVFCAGTFAYEVDDYIYTKDARLKVAGANIASNDFNNQAAWSNEVGGPLAANWAVKSIAGPDGANVNAVESQGASNDEGNALTATWQLQSGVYAISFYVYSPLASSVSITSGGSNFMSFLCGETNRQINAIATLAEAAWTQITDTVVVSTESEILSFKATGVVEGTALANFEIVPVEEVYDIRIAQRETAYAQSIIDNPALNTEDAAAQRGNVEKVLAAIAQNIENGNLDDAQTAEGLLNRLNTALVAFLNVNTTDIATEDNFQYVTDVTQMPHKNRGNIANGEKLGGFIFRGDNWYHQWSRDAENKPTIADNPVIWKQIQGTNYTNGPGSVALYNELMPAGKYFIAAEMRNADCANDYTLTFNLESPIKAFVGSDSLEVGTIVGEDFTKFYFVGTLNEGEVLEAGFYWDNQDPNGSTFQIKNFEIRSFGNNADKVARAKAWNAFKAQYEAMVNGRKDAQALVGDKNYPWGQQQLSDSLSKWNPKYDVEVAKGWIDEDGNDTYVASLEELEDWAEQQGQNPNAGDYQKYPIVRGYQGAINKVKSANQVFSDLAADIDAAKGVLADPMNVNGDKDTFQAAINTAEETHDNLFASTSEATMEADSLTLATARTDLAAAVEAFKASAVLEPFIDIDFSNTFEAIEEEGVVVSYVVKGAAGEMTFPADVVETDRTADVTMFQLGWGAVDNTFEVLRVGKGAGTVAVPDVVTENDIIRASFDVWFGKFVTYGYLSFDLQNAAGERIAGFSYCRYDNATKYNDFTGLDFGKTNNISNVNNESILTDANKTTMEIIVDNKAQSIQAVMTTNSGTYTSEPAPLPALEDTKVAKIVLASEYTNGGRRSWFDNLKVYKYPSSAEGPIFDGIQTVNVKAADNAVYTLSGVRVKSAVKPGLYIVNGKKVAVK